MHRSIDDHIDQLLGRVPDEDTSLPPTYCATLKADNWKPDGNAKGAKCQHCERSRYINTKGARLCFACDMAPLSGEWEVLHADEAEQ